MSGAPAAGVVAPRKRFEPALAVRDALAFGDSDLLADWLGSGSKSSSSD